MDLAPRASCTRARPTAACPNFASCTDHHSEAIGPTGPRQTGRRAAVGESLLGGVAAQVTEGFERVFGCVNAEIDESLAPQFELDPVHRLPSRRRSPHTSFHHVVALVSTSAVLS
jgi:hypothetical protein